MHRGDPTHHGWTGWLFAAPALALLALFLALPLVLAVALSLTSYRLNAPPHVGWSWVGLAHYAELAADAGFLRALGNNLYFAAVVVPVQTVLALAVAVALDRPLRAGAAFRACFFLPVVYPMALVSVVWGLIYAPGPDGLLNLALHALSGGTWTAPATWSVLDSPRWAMPAIMALSIWQGMGFQTVILLAGLQGIPAELHEAAMIDGAGRWRRFLHVTLPGLRGPLAFTVLVTTIFAFRLFDQVRILTPDGGPGGATATVMLEIVRAAQAPRGAIGAASAMTVVFFAIVCALALVQRRLARRREAA